ncbi:MAG: GHKL domain-containing protein, partial [Planctomycetales bacterium]|nr:GHKL domain-containing protein [Planctomycetales bacterium]
VFNNILENALQACGEQPEIHVTYAEQNEPRRSVSIAIRDNGGGIAPQHMTEVFDSFFTTKSEGTGLGMAIAQRIVEAHGGRIAINTVLREGAEFVVTLPRNEK